MANLGDVQGASLFVTQFPIPWSEVMWYVTVVKIEKALLFLAPEEIPGGPSGQAWLIGPKVKVTCESLFSMWNYQLFQILVLCLLGQDGCWIIFWNFPCTIGKSANFQKII